MGIRIGFHIGLRSACCHLRRAALVFVSAFFVVAADIASAGDIFICVQASDIAIGMLIVGDVPGL